VVKAVIKMVYPILAYPISNEASLKVFGNHPLLVIRLEDAETGDRSGGLGALREPQKVYPSLSWV
jgi:hypothetical protein